jgi:hypothetical protein
MEVLIDGEIEAVKKRTIMDFLDGSGSTANNSKKRTTPSSRRKIKIAPSTSCVNGTVTSALSHRWR